MVQNPETIDRHKKWNKVEISNLALFLVQLVQEKMQYFRSLNLTPKHFDAPEITVYCNDPKTYIIPGIHL